MAIMDSPGTAAKRCGRARQTPGSGEDLLRGQVKTLLQRIEEEGVVEVGRDAVVVDRLPSSLFLGLTDSPALRFLAPTPANTPLTVDVAGTVVDAAKKDGPEIILVLPAIQPKQGTVIDDLESPLTRALLFDDDSPGKSNISDSSARYSEITCEGSFKSIDDDGSSVWSTQANSGSNNDEDEEAAIEVYYEEEEEEEGDIYGIEELCSGLSRVCVQEKRLPEFEGRHTRFTYNSDDEIEGEEEAEPFVSPSVLRLKGLPMPMGKHLRFPEQDDEE